MKNLFQKIYLKFITFKTKRFLKKFGYKFIIIFLSLFIFPSLSFAEIQNYCYGSTGREYLVQASRTSSFWGTGYLVNESSFTVIPYEDDKTSSLIIPKDSNYNSVINFQFAFRYESFYSYPIVVSLQVFDGSRWVNATCDGELYNDVYSQDFDPITERYETTFYWDCERLDLTQTFSQIRFSVSGLSGLNPVFTLVSVDSITYDYYCDSVDIPDYLASIEELQSLSYNIFNRMAVNWESGTINNKTYSWSDWVRMHLLEQSALTSYNYDDLDFDDLDISYSSDAVSFLYTNVNSLIDLSSKYKVFIISCLSLGVVALIYARRGH